MRTMSFLNCLDDGYLWFCVNSWVWSAACCLWVLVSARRQLTSLPCPSSRSWSCPAGSPSGSAPAATAPLQWVVPHVRHHPAENRPLQSALPSSQSADILPKPLLVIIISSTKKTYTNIEKQTISCTVNLANLCHLLLMQHYKILLSPLNRKGYFQRGWTLLKVDLQKCLCGYLNKIWITDVETLWLPVSSM